MIIVKNKLSYNYFVADRWCWTRDFTEASFFLSVEEARESVMQELPNINHNDLSFYSVSFKNNRMVLKNLSLEEVVV